MNTINVLNVKITFTILKVKMHTRFHKATSKITVIKIF